MINFNVDNFKKLGLKICYINLYRFINTFI